LKNREKYPQSGNPSDRAIRFAGVLV